MGDITMDKHGTFYITDRKHLLKVIPIPDAWNYISYDTLATFPTDGIVSLAIDCNDVIFAASINSKEIYSYNLNTGQMFNYGKYNAKYFFDFEFFNGYLHALCYQYPNGSGVTTLLKIHLDNLTLKDTVVLVHDPDSIETSYGIANITNQCVSNLYSLKFNGFIKYDSTGKNYSYIALSGLCLGGATSPTSWMGAYAPLIIDSVHINQHQYGCLPRYKVSIFHPDGYCDRPGLEFSLDGINYQDSSIFHNISSGIYIPTLRDSFGCVVRGDTLKLRGAQFHSNTQVIPEYCSLQNGKIFITGDTSLSYAPIEGTFIKDSLLLSSLSSGTYPVIRKNNSGCLDTLTLTVPGIAPFTVSTLATTDTCGRGQGSVRFTPSGNRGALSLSLDSINYSPGTSWQGLSSGDYDLFIQDSAGCVISQTIHISDIPPPQINNLIETDPGCNSANGTISVQATTPGVLFSLNGNTNTTGLFNALSAGDYTLFLTDSLGCMSDTSITLTGRNAPLINRVSIHDAHCSQDNGSLTIGVNPSDTVQISIDSLHFFSELSFDSLAAGDYTLFVRNAAGCITTTKITIAQTGLPHFDNLEIKEPSCDSINGAIRVSGSGHAPLSYTLEGNTANTAGYFGHLSEGVYNLAIADMYGCTIDTLIHLEHRGSAAVGDISVSPGSCGERFGVLHLAGQADNSYILPQVGRTAYPGDTLHLSPGDYRLIISNTICSLDTVITIPHSDCPYFIPNVFSPNHDGINDLFKPEGKIDLIALEIFNRWGDHIYTGHGTQAAWDGRFQGKDMPPGVYVYWMRIRKADGSESMAKGEVTLLK